MLCIVFINFKHNLTFNTLNDFISTFYIYAWFLKDNLIVKLKRLRSDEVMIHWDKCYSIDLNELQ